MAPRLSALPVARCADAPNGAAAGACGGGVRLPWKLTPLAPPPEEPLALQLWALLLQLCDLAAEMHPLHLCECYGALTSGGVLACAAAALEADPPAAWGMLHVRCIDVLLALCRHDPAILRRADVASLAAGRHGGADDGTIVGAAVRLLGRTADEGVVEQLAELLTILLDPSTMEPAEQNAFLDGVYEGGYMSALMRAFERSAAVLVPGGGSGSDPAVGHARVRAVCSLLPSSVENHGYRGRRLALDASMWNACGRLLDSKARDVRCTVVRFVRAMLQAVPTCATCVAEHALLAPMLAQLCHGGLRRCGLGESAVLQLLCTIADDPPLTFLREHLVRRHRQQLERLADAKIAAASAILSTSVE